MATAPSTPDSQRRTAALSRMTSLSKMLATVINDRQPDAQKQTPETEWRRQRDLASSINTVRDVVSALIEAIQDGTLSPLSFKGQLLSNNGTSDVPLDPPQGGVATQSAILRTDVTRKAPSGLLWDSDLYQQIQDCCGGGGINHIDYGLITAGVGLSEDYGAVADPPLSSIDWGGID
jgi:hypothetical protein